MMRASMHDLRPWIFLGLGLLLAGLTGLALFGVSQEYGTRQVAASEMTEVVVARVPIAARSVVAGDALARRSYPRSVVPTGAVLHESEAVGQTTLVEIPEGGAMLRSQLAAAGGRTGTSLTVEKGKVMVAFPTVDPLTMAGLVRVGDRVDILATLTTTGDGTRRTQTMLQNLEVIDVLSPPRDQPQRVTSLTFVVDHQVALVLKYLRDAQATIDIAVRSRSEVDIATTAAVDITYLIQAYGLRR